MDKYINLSTNLLKSYLKLKNSNIYLINYINNTIYCNKKLLIIYKKTIKKIRKEYLKTTNYKCILDLKKYNNKINKIKFKITLKLKEIDIINKENIYIDNYIIDSVTCDLIKINEY